KKLREYVDGKEVGTAADLGENTLDKVRPVHNWIGRSAFDPNGGLSGSINEFRVYSRALSAGDAAAIAKAGADVVPARATVPAGSGR
ncbi:MAG TPA: LamG-like jellyroll fold domain-containing protein, partial [Phycisphaerae bacterium]